MSLSYNLRTARAHAHLNFTSDLLLLHPPTHPRTCTELADLLHPLTPPHTISALRRSLPLASARFTRPRLHTRQLVPLPSRLLAPAHAPPNEPGATPAKLPTTARRPSRSACFASPRVISPARRPPHPPSLRLIAAGSGRPSCRTQPRNRDAAAPDHGIFGA